MTDNMITDVDRLPPEVNFFSLETVGEGVFAAISDSPLAASNAGIIALGDGALLFDTCISHLAADELRRAATHLTHTPVRYAVNSHWHPDHVLGASALPGSVPLISTGHTRELIDANIPGRIRTMRQQRSQIDQELREAQRRLDGLTDPDARRALQEEIQLKHYRLDALNNLTMRLPNSTFERQMAVYGSERAVELLTFGGGHTASDAVLWLADERILFTADLLFNGIHPWMGDGDPDEWLRIIDDLLALDPAVVVPGHGPIATADELAALKTYIPQVQAAVVDLLAEPLPDDEADDDITMRISVPAGLADLEGEELFLRSVAALVTRALAQQPQPDADDAPPNDGK
jgi:cyclase